MAASSKTELCARVVSSAIRGFKSLNVRRLRKMTKKAKLGGEKPSGKSPIKKTNLKVFWPLPILIDFLTFSKIFCPEILVY